MKPHHKNEYLTGGDQLKQLANRQKKAGVWSLLFQSSTLIAILALGALLYNIINGSFGLLAVENKVSPKELSVDGVPYEKLNHAQLSEILDERLSKGIRRKELKFRARDLGLDDKDKANLTWDHFEAGEMRNLILDKIIVPEYQQSWNLVPSLLHRASIKAEVEEKYPNAELVFRSWVRGPFLSSGQSSDIEKEGIRAAIKGSLLTILITILFSFPLGVGAAIYLEEYAKDNKFNQLIQTNISNLAGVPSIIYGMLGLAFFVRIMEPVTSGALFLPEGEAAANGRTILSAGLTLGLLILPIIIINGQEAIKAVSPALRHASLGVGATQWQTIWYHVLPGAMPGILTGTILAVSRAIGETAPLVVVGASTFITIDPSGPFSKFTTLPIQIYQWTAEPEYEYKHLAAAAILVLMTILLTLNAFAIYSRNQYRKKQSA